MCVSFFSGIQFGCCVFYTGLRCKVRAVVFYSDQAAVCGLFCADEDIQTEAFAGGAVQSDDRTILCLRYR